MIKVVQTRLSNSGSYQYDPNGNRTSDPTYGYSYDVENHLTQLTQGGNVVLQNTFDGDGARLMRVANATTTHYIGDWYEDNPTTSVATVYYPFNGQAVAMKTGSTLYYLHRDQVGSVVSVSDASGNEVGSARYWPFGGIRTSTGTLPTDRLFTGQIRDLGDDRLYFFKARYYDATIGKFQTPDSIVPNAGNAQALNRYAYGLNNPLRLVDPTGHVYSDPSDGPYKPDSASYFSPSWFDASWVRAFRSEHSGQNPTVNDYAYRFITLARANHIAVPEGFAIPQGVDLGANFAYGQKMSQFGTASGPVSQDNASFMLASFAGLVRPGGAWDYKAHYGNKYFGFGNFNFGAAGAAFGYSENFLERGAGAAQYPATGWTNLVILYGRLTGKDTTTPYQSVGPGNPFGGPTYGDVPQDNAMVELGFEFFQLYSAAPPPASVTSAP